MTPHGLGAWRARDKEAATAIENNHFLLSPPTPCIVASARGARVGFSHY
jgi:hypothetical protein